MMPEFSWEHCDTMHMRTLLHNLVCKSTDAAWYMQSFCTLVCLPSKRSIIHGIKTYHRSFCQDSWKPASVSSHGPSGSAQTPQSPTGHPSLCLQPWRFSETHMQKSTSKPHERTIYLRTVSQCCSGCWANETLGTDIWPMFVEDSIEWTTMFNNLMSISFMRAILTTFDL